MNTTKEMRDQEMGRLSADMQTEEIATEENAAEEIAVKGNRPDTTPELTQALQDFENAVKNLGEIKGVKIFAVAKYPAIAGSATCSVLNGSILDIIEALLSARSSENNMRGILNHLSTLIEDPFRETLFLLKWRLENGADPAEIMSSFNEALSYNEILGQSPLVSSLPISPKAEATIKEVLKEAFRKNIQSESDKTPTAE